MNAPLVAAHIDELKQTLQLASVKIHLAAPRHWCDQLVLGHVLPFNPTAAVRGDRRSQTGGKTPFMSAGEAKHLFASVDASTLLSTRDRALMALLLYSFARIGAALQMRVSDYRGAGTNRPSVCAA